MEYRYTQAKDLTRPTQVSVNLSAIAHNYQQFCAHVGDAKVMPVVKANAYGHGLEEVALYLRELAPPYFGVATFEEALSLRDCGIDTPILVFGGMFDEQIPLYIKRKLTLTASSVSKLKSIDKAAEKLGIRPNVHLKIDTGMERVGVHYYNADHLLTAARHCQHVTVTGIYTHFASADEADSSFYNTQLLRFKQVCERAKTELGQLIICHAANSAAAIRYPESHLDMVRVGISLFGVLPALNIRHTLNLRPALTWHSKVVYFKVVRAGDTVSYGGTWAPKTDTRIVTVPVGYADGYSRQLSNIAQVRIHNKYYPVIGKICMDQLMVDIGQDSAFNGDTVTLLGEGIDAHQLASWQSSIAYEVLTTIGSRVPRAYVFDNELNDSEKNGQSYDE